MKNVYKFVRWEVAPLETYKESPVYKLLEKLNNGGTLTREEKDNSIFNELWHYETYRTGRYKLMGYVYDFRPFMKTYLVKWKYDGWKEQKAFDKTFIRKNAVYPSHILKIVELEG